jgi:exosome complex component RRP45
MIVQGLKLDTRADLRKLSETRSLKVDLSPGQSLLNIGKTCILSKVSAEIVKPRLNAPTEGIFSFSVRISQMSGSNASNELAFKENQLSHWIERTLKKARVLDTEGLCVQAGEKVWGISVDAKVLDDDGNVRDALMLGVITALMGFVRPDVTVSGIECVVHTPEEKTPIPLSIHHIPIPITFAFFKQDGFSAVVVDPTWEEESVASGKMTIVVNCHEEVCGFSSEGLDIDPITFQKCLNVALEKSKSITQLIQEFIAAEKSNNQVS